MNFMVMKVNYDKDINIQFNSDNTACVIGFDDVIKV